MIQKLDIETICDNIEVEIKKNTISLGFDVAQNKTGVCLLRTDNQYLYIEALECICIKKGKKTLHQVIDEFESKAQELKLQIEKLKLKCSNKILMIEDCWFGKSVWTTKILAKFAVLVYIIFKHWATETPDPIQPITARNIIKFPEDKGKFHFEEDDNGKKHKVWDIKPLDVKKQVQNYLSDELDVDIQDAELSDGFVLAFAGLIDRE